MSSLNPNPGGDPKSMPRPRYAVHEVGDPPGEVPRKKSYGIDADGGPYSQWRIYNDFKPITKDERSWPEKYTLLQDWHIPHVMDNMVCAVRKERYPADFDGAGQIRSQRYPRGRAAKEDSTEADGTVVKRYAVYKKYYQLHGDEGNRMKHHVKVAAEDTRGAAVRGYKAWSLGDVALVQADFIPTKRELLDGTRASRYDKQDKNATRTAKGRTTSKTSRPRSSRSRTPAVPIIGVANNEPEPALQEENATAAAATITNEANKEPESVLGEEIHCQNFIRAVEAFTAGNNPAMGEIRVKLPEILKEILQMLQAVSITSSTDANDKAAESHKVQILVPFTHSVAIPKDISAKIAMDDDADPFNLLGVKEPTTPTQQFYINGTKDQNRLEGLEESRIDSIRMIGALQTFYQREISCGMENNNATERWIKNGIKAMQQALLTSVNGTAQVNKIVAAFNIGSILTQVMDTRREKLQKGVLERLGDNALIAERIPVYLDLIQNCDPAGPQPDEGFAAQPPPLKIPVHEEDIKQLVGALQEKQWLNTAADSQLYGNNKFRTAASQGGAQPSRGPIPAVGDSRGPAGHLKNWQSPTAVMGVPIDPAISGSQGTAAAAEASGSVKRAAVPTEGEEPAAKRARARQATETVQPSVEEEDKDGEDDSDETISVEDDDEEDEEENEEEAGSNTGTS